MVWCTGWAADPLGYCQAQWVYNNVEVRVICPISCGTCPPVARRFLGSAAGAELNGAAGTQMLAPVPHLKR